MSKILLIGFSVTEMPLSYVPVLKSMIDTRGADISVVQCGIGGITNEHLVYFIDEAIEHYADCSHVTLEITTSYVRQIYAARISEDKEYFREIWRNIEALIFKCWARGKSVSFVNLPRRDVDYTSDFFESIIAQVCGMHGVPVLSVSYDYFLKDIPLDALFTDVVHPTRLGSELYAEKILSFLTSIDTSARKVESWSIPEKFGSISIPDHTDAPSDVFRRHGFVSNYAIIKGGETLTMVLPQPTKIAGLSVICGPKSGNLTVTTDIARDFLLYDEYCYYERMMTFAQDLGVTSEIKFHLGVETPAIPLIKGEKDEGPRQMGLFRVFYER